MSRSYKPSKEDAKILEEIRTRYDYAKTQWDPIIAEGRTDLQYIAGQTWDQEDKKQRAGRLTLQFDQIGQYLNQVVNAWRQNKRAIKVSPRGDGATEDSARIRANRIRQIEYESKAQEAYVAAFTGSLERSFGYCRVVSEFDGPRSRTKTPRILSIPNPEQVLPDPDFRLVAGGDWKYLFYLDPMPRKEFQDRWPDAKTGTFSPDLKSIASDWHNEDQVIVAEYWKVEKTKRRLLFIGVDDATALGYFEDEIEAAIASGKIPPGSTIHGERMADKSEVCKYVTNGVELLEGEDGKKRYDWPGKFIPFAACYGKILYMSDQGISKRIILSFIRLARDAQKYFNWLKSTEGEAIKIPVRSSLWAYRGQLSMQEMADAQDSLNNPKVVLTAGALSEETGNQILPLPNREMPNINIQAYEIAAEAARRDIQNALGRYSASVGRADTNVKSGVALKQLDQQSDQGSYHFTDAGDSMVEHVGEILDDLLEHFDDTAKTITTRDATDRVQDVRVNDPMAVDKAGKPAVMMMNEGSHLVTIGTGPAVDSERELAVSFLDSLLVNMDQVARVIGPKPTAALFGLGIRLRQMGPEGDKMAEIVSPEDQGAVNPDELKARIQHAEAAMQQLNAALEKSEAGNETKLKIAAMDNATKKEIAAADRESEAADREVKLAVAELSAKMKDIQLFMEERKRLGVQGHEAAMSQQEHGQELQRQQEAHAHETAQQQDAQAHDAALTTATLPPPETAAEATT